MVVVCSPVVSAPGVLPVRERHLTRRSRLVGHGEHQFPVASPVLWCAIPVPHWSEAAMVSG